MTRLQKIVLWTVAVCVFGYMSANVLIIKAPSAGMAQDAPGRTSQAPDKGGVTDDPLATDPETPEDRTLTAICVGDKGEPLDDVIVDIFRETKGESVFDPRVEGFGRTKTKDDGKFSVTLPLIQGKTEESQAAAMYILYFTSPVRPIKSLIVDNDTELPKEIVIPNESTEEVYLPTHHLVVAKPAGISVSPMLSAIRGFSKDGQPIRVAQLVDHRNEGKSPASGHGASMGRASGFSSRGENDIRSPEAILMQGIRGKATVAFQVGKVDIVNVDALFVPDVSHDLVIAAKVPAAKTDQEFLVIVRKEVATRLLQLGIQDPAEHFRGKILRVSGTVEHITRPSTPSALIYRIDVTNLDQLESIRKP